MKIASSRKARCISFIPFTSKSRYPRNFEISKRQFPENHFSDSSVAAMPSHVIRPKSVSIIAAMQPISYWFAANGPRSIRKPRPGGLKKISWRTSRSTEHQTNFSNWKKTNKLAKINGTAWVMYEDPSQRLIALSQGKRSRWKRPHQKNKQPFSAKSKLSRLLKKPQRSVCELPRWLPLLSLITFVASALRALRLTLWFFILCRWVVIENETRTPYFQLNCN